MFDLLSLETYQVEKHLTAFSRFTHRAYDVFGPMGYCTALVHKAALRVAVRKH